MFVVGCNARICNHGNEMRQRLRMVLPNMNVFIGTGFVPEKQHEHVTFMWPEIWTIALRIFFRAQTPNWRRDVLDLGTMLHDWGAAYHDMFGSLLLGAAYQALTLLACDACEQTLPATAPPFAHEFFDLANLAWAADRSGLPWNAKWEAWDWSSRPWGNRERGFGAGSYWVGPEHGPDVRPPY